MSKRSQLLVLLVLFVILAIAIPYRIKRAAQAAQKPTPTQMAWATTRARLLVYMRSQPEIRDAHYIDRNLLYLSVLDDGTDWEAYAVSACRILVSRGVKDIVSIKLIDFVKDSAGQGIHQLGQSSCP